MKNKVLLLFSILYISFTACHAAYTEEENHQRDKWGEECIKDTKVNPDLVVKSIEEKIYEDDDDLKNFFVCFANKIGILGIKEKELETLMGKILDDEEQAKKVKDKCFVDKGTIKETVFALFPCYRKATNTML